MKQCRASVYFSAAIILVFFTVRLRVGISRVMVRDKMPMFAIASLRLHMFPVQSPLSPWETGKYARSLLI